jgi:3-oxoadipate enol-lactonase
MTTKILNLSSGPWSVEDRGEGKVILLVHGFPLDHAMWRRQIESLSRRYRVIAPDLIGFGQSGPVESFSMATLADGLASLLDQLQISEKICYCGLSMGGYIGWEFWSRHTARLDRFIACDTKSQADSPEAAEGRKKLADKVRTQGAEPVLEAMLPKLFGPNAQSSIADDYQATKHVISTTKPATLIAALMAMAARRDFTAELPNITVKSLVVCGEHDVITPVKEMRAMAGAMPSAKFVQIDGVGHMAPLEAPLAFDIHVDEFLSDWL